MKESRHFQLMITDTTGDYSAILRACTTRNRDLVKLLANYGAPIRYQNIQGNHPFHICATLNSLKTLDFLIPFEKDIDIINKEGWTPAHIASLMGHGDMLNLLIEHGAKILLKHNSKMHCLHEIIRANHKELLEAVYKYIGEDDQTRNQNEVKAL